MHFKFRENGLEKIGFYENLSNALIVNLKGYCNNEKNEKRGYSYNLMLKIIPYHIMAELNSIPIKPAYPRTHIYRK